MRIGWHVVRMSSRVTKTMPARLTFADLPAAPVCEPIDFASRISHASPSALASPSINRVPRFVRSQAARWLGVLVVAEGVLPAELPERSR